MEDNTVIETTLFEAAKRFPLLVGVSAIALAVLALLTARIFMNDWVAESSVLIEDPVASQLFGSPSLTQPERYLASQVAIIESPDMAEAVQMLIDGGEGLSVREILDSRDINTSRDTDLIRISFVNADPDLAIEHANAYGGAYQSYRETATAGSFASAIAGLDESIAAVDAELATIDDEIESLSSVPGLSDFEMDLEDAIAGFLAAEPDSEVAAELGNILSQLQTLQLIRTLEAQNLTFSLLVETRRDIMDRRSQLVVRRDQLQVDAALASTGIVAFSEATEAGRATSASRLAALGLILGLLAGVGLAYTLAVRNRRFDHRTEPELVLEIPMLAEVPKFGGIGRVELLPVLNKPSSPAAEAFRFTGNAIVARLNQLALQSGSSRQSIAVTSALLGDGKTVVTVNTGLSMATRGKSVLIIDADFGDPALSRMLVDDPTKAKGVTNVVEDIENLSDVVIPVNLGQGHHVDVLTRGTVEISAGDFFNSSATRELFHLIKARYDYILIDCPSLLQVSYATSVVGLADGVVAVIPHDGGVSIQQELADRLDLIGTDTVGYVYNKAPKRPELVERKGSMTDIMGSGSIESQPTVNK